MASDGSAEISSVGDTPKKRSLENHAEPLSRRMASLFGVNNAMTRYSDVQIKLGKRIFYCHKFVLQLSSDYFTNLAFESGVADLQVIDPAHFYDVLDFMYTGEVLFTEENIESLLSAADILSIHV